MWAPILVLPEKSLPSIMMQLEADMQFSYSLTYCQKGSPPGLLSSAGLGLPLGMV